VKSYFHNIQALRGIACLLVVLVHVWNLEHCFGYETPVFRELRWFGFAGVDLFFVLSGFIITATNRDSLGRPSKLPSFLFRRFWRIYPIFWVAAALHVIYFRLQHGPTTLDPGLPWLHWMTLVPTDQHFMYQSQSWTLSFEILFYLGFGVLIALPARWSPALLTAWAGVILLFAFRPLPESVLLQHAVSPLVLEFLAGCLVAVTIRRGVTFGWRLAAPLAITWATLAVWLADTYCSEPFLLALADQHVRVAVFGVPAAFLVYFFAAAEKRSSFRFPRWLIHTGDASYSLYLIHSLLIAGFMLLGYFIPHTRLSHTLWIIGAFTSAMAAGFLLHRFVERPLLALGKRRLSLTAAFSRWNPFTRTISSRHVP
jgi:peptidoglycan/LPS O-acetylase OafA/YrhL